jgi:hypothetical protein
VSGRLAVLTIVLAGCVPGTAGWAHEGAGMVSCGKGVRATVVDCGKARRLAKEYLKTRDRSLWLYTCTPGGKRGRCVLDRKIVTFPLG